MMKWWSIAKEFGIEAVEPDPDTRGGFVGVVDCSLAPDARKAFQRAGYHTSLSEDEGVTYIWWQS